MAQLFAELDRKNPDIDGIARMAQEHPDGIPVLLAGLDEPKARIRYGCEKVLRRVSERAPARLYAHFDAFAALLDSKNSFLKWGAILTLANLVSVDRDKRFDGILDRYFAPIGGPVMVTAANIVGAAGRIARSRPDLAGRIVREILKAEAGRYEHRGAPSPECTRVVCGHAVDAFDGIYDLIEEREEREAVIAFVRRQLASPRPQVRKKAEGFFRRHGDAEGQRP